MRFTKHNGDQEKTRQLISKLTRNEINLLYLKYFTRDKEILMYKEFGFALDLKILEQELSNRAIEEVLLA